MLAYLFLYLSVRLFFFPYLLIKVLYIFWYVLCSCVVNIFFNFMVLFDEQKLSILNGVRFNNIFFYSYVLWLLKKVYPTLKSRRFLLKYFPKNFKILILRFRHLIHVELIFIYSWGINCADNFSIFICKKAFFP